MLSVEFVGGRLVSEEIPVLRPSVAQCEVQSIELETKPNPFHVFED